MKPLRFSDLLGKVLEEDADEPLALALAVRHPLKGSADRQDWDGSTAGNGVLITMVVSSLAP